ncbi:MAG: P-loop NTPase [Microcoleus sp. SIO2G3]|nr:P-loop NTPase [Microcoleus sp. SIO2G3]
MNRILAIAFRHWKPIVGLNAILVAIASHSALSVTQVWTAQAEMIVPNTNSDLKASLGTLGDIQSGGVTFSQQLNPLKILSSIMTSNDAISQVWEKDPEKELYPRLSSYKGLFEVSPQTESTVISVSVTGSSPEVANKRTALFIEAFQHRLNQLRQDDAAQRAKFMQKELEQARQNLSQTQADLTKFKASANLVSSEDQIRESVAAINTLITTQAQVLAQAKGSEDQAKMLSTRLQLNPDQAIKSLSLGENQDYLYLRQKLSEVEAALTEAQAKFTENHPSVQTMVNQRDELRRQIEQYVARTAANTKGVNPTTGDNTATLIEQLVLAESQASSFQSQANQIQMQIDKQNALLKALPAAQAQLGELQRQHDIAEGVYNGLVAQVKQVKLNAFSTYPSVQLLDKPNVDPKPTGPGRRPIAAGTLLASVFGSIALALLLESRNPLLSPKDLQAAEAPLLRNIPRFKHLAKNIDPRFETAIEFQRLASAVSLMHLEKRRLMIASATIGEGKTTVTLGLATALLTLGFRILIVDGDFARAELSRRLGHSPQTPLNAKSTPVSVRPGLDLLPTLPQKNKIAEFIARGGFEECLSTVQAAGDYDYILVDSPPVSLTSEAALMATVVPNVLLVVWPGSSNRNPFIESIEQLTRHKAQIVGLVVNGVETRTEGYLYGQNFTQVHS